MLSYLESAFVRLLRGTVVASAFISLLIAVAALLYAGYAQFAPEPTAKLSQQITRFRQATDPSKLIKEVFPTDSVVYKEASASQDDVVYELRQPTDEMVFNEFNKFLDVALSASFDSQKQFTDWLYGSGRIPFSWSKSIEDENAKDENNVNVLWRSLIVDYAKRLSFRGISLGAARKQKLNSIAFDKLTVPSGVSQAPYFLAWFFETLQNELRDVSVELDSAKEQRAALRLTVLLALGVAASAFGYFIVVMFLFLLVSIEASVRRIAESA